MTCVCPRATDIESSGAASLLSRSERKNNSPRRFILHSRKRRGRHSTIREKCADKAAGAAECGYSGATVSHFTHGSLKSKDRERRVAGFTISAEDAPILAWIIFGNLPPTSENPTKKS